MLANGSKDQIAMLPPYIRKDGENKIKSFRYLSLNHIAYQFACKENTLTLIFNHSSTEFLDPEVQKIDIEEEMTDEIS